MLDGKPILCRNRIFSYHSTATQSNREALPCPEIRTPRSRCSSHLIKSHPHVPNLHISSKFIDLSDANTTFNPFPLLTPHPPALPSLPQPQPLLPVTTLFSSLPPVPSLQPVYSFPKGHIMEYFQSDDIQTSASAKPFAPLICHGGIVSIYLRCVSSALLMIYRQERMRRWISSTLVDMLPPSLLIPLP